VSPRAERKAHNVSQERDVQPGCISTSGDRRPFCSLCSAYSFVPLILLVLLLLLLLGAFFLALSVLFFMACAHFRRRTKEFFQAFAPQGAGPPATARLGQLFLVWPSW
jgi:Flp pilus assembly protein TadB